MPRNGAPDLTMKPFSFRLDSILNYRNYLEKKAQRDLFTARGKVMMWEKEIIRLSQQRVKTAQECSEEGSRGIGVPQYQLYRSFLQRLDDDLEGAHISRKKAERNVKEKQEFLKKESIKKKSLEALKDLQHKKYLKRLEKEEQKAMDELVIMRTGGMA